MCPWIGTTLMVTGAAVGIGAVLALRLHIPLHPPGWMVTVAIYKGAFAGAMGLLAVGALVRRRALLASRRTLRELPGRHPPAH
jgi:hypothetical protein